MADRSKQLAPQTIVDFDGLFNLWASSCLNIEDFWDGTGLRVEVGDDRLAQLHRNDWRPRLRALIEATPSPPPEWRRTMRATRLGNMEAGDIHVPRLTPPALMAAMLPAEIYDLDDDADPDAFVESKRPRQAVGDWKIADRLARYIRDKMRFAYLETDDPNNPGRRIAVPILSAADIRALAGALKDLQTMQRLALGLSSDNIGLNSQPQMPTVHVHFGPKDDGGEGAT